MMIPVILLAALLAFRAVGALGVARFETWRASAAHALAVLLLVTASAHFMPDGVSAMPTHQDLVAMVPPAIPFPSAVVYLTGILELVGAAGLAVGRFRRPAGICLALLFVALVPANIYAAVADIELAGEPASPLWQRVPEQLVYIGFALWAAGLSWEVPVGIRSRAQ